jgi:hypothetical protein
MNSHKLSDYIATYRSAYSVGLLTKKDHSQYIVRFECMTFENRDITTCQIMDARGLPILTYNGYVPVIGGVAVRNPKDDLDWEVGKRHALKVACLRFERKLDNNGYQILGVRGAAIYDAYRKMMYERRLFPELPSIFYFPGFLSVSIGMLR